MEEIGSDIVSPQLLPGWALIKVMLRVTALSAEVPAEPLEAVGLGDSSCCEHATCLSLPIETILAFSYRGGDSKSHVLFFS